nr:prepilin peptidase [Hoeflea prorocentri]
MTSAIMVVFPLCLAFAAISDALTMTIPNRVSVILLATFAIVAPIAGLPWQDYAMHFAAGLIVFVVCFGLFGIGVMGGGDAKLLTATAVWFGLNMELLDFLVAVAMIGGLLTILLVICRLPAFAIYRFGPVSHLLEPKAGIPYGIAIGIAALICYPQSPLVQMVLLHH